MGKGTEFNHTSSNLDEDFEGYEEWLDWMTGNEATKEDVMLEYEDDCVEEEEEEEQEDEECDLCQGTGIGQHGDPDTSRCSQCGGNGVVKSQEYRDRMADYRYDCYADDNL